MPVAATHKGRREEGKRKAQEEDGEKQNGNPSRERHTWTSLDLSGWCLGLPSLIQAFAPMAKFSLCHTLLWSSGHCPPHFIHPSGTVLVASVHYIVPEPERTSAVL